MRLNNTFKHRQHKNIFVMFKRMVPYISKNEKILVNKYGDKIIIEFVNEGIEIILTTKKARELIDKMVRLL